MEIIPAIDLMNGACVRLTQGNYNQKTVYYDDPVDAAKVFEDAGYRSLHLVDLDGAKSEGIKNLAALSAITAHTSLLVEFSGGLKNEAEVRKAFDAGAHRVSIGSIAATNTPLFLNLLAKYGGSKVILSADSKNRKIATGGWINQSETHVIRYITDFAKHGVKTVICTDITRDGMLGGAALDLYKDILAQVKIGLIASGGVASTTDLINLQKVGCSGVIVGRAFYEGTIPLSVREEVC